MQLFFAKIILSEWFGPYKARSTVSRILEQLGSHPAISLLLTMRGTEMPVRHKIKWGQLPPLQPLDQAAAAETFIAIAGPRYSQVDAQVKALMHENEGAFMGSGVSG